MTEAQTPDAVSRYTILLSTDHQSVLAKTAKRHKISQREVLEAMIDTTDFEKMAATFDKIREEKVAGRGVKKDLIRKLSSLDPAELERLLATSK